MVFYESQYDVLRVLLTKVLVNRLHYTTERAYRAYSIGFMNRLIVCIYNIADR